MDSRKFHEELKILMERYDGIVKESRRFQRLNNTVLKRLAAFDADLLRLYKKAGVKSN